MPYRIHDYRHFAGKSKLGKSLSVVDLMGVFSDFPPGAICGYTPPLSTMSRPDIPIYVRKEISKNIFLWWKRGCEDLELSKKQMAKITGDIPLPTVYRWLANIRNGSNFVIRPRRVRAIERVVSIFLIAEKIFKNKTICINWFNERRQEFNGLSPMELMEINSKTAYPILVNHLKKIANNDNL